MPLAMIVLIFRLARLRIVLIGLVAAVLVWPLVFEARNQISSGFGETSSQITRDAEERLNLSRQLALLDEYGRQDVEAPSLMTMVRYGLVPSAIDRGREPLALGFSINSAYGGSGPSSQSLTVLGNLYLFTNWLGIVIYIGVVAVMMRCMLRSRLVVVVASALVIQSLLWVDSMYPTSVAALLQSLVSLSAAVLLMGWLTRSLPERRRRRRIAWRLRRVPSLPIDAR